MTEWKLDKRYKYDSDTDEQTGEYNDCYVLVLNGKNNVFITLNVQIEVDVNKEYDPVSVDYIITINNFFKERVRTNLEDAKAKALVHLKLVIEQFKAEYDSVEKKYNEFMEKNK